LAATFTTGEFTKYTMTLYREYADDCSTPTNI
jgi:hypothetical protein